MNTRGLLLDLFATDALSEQRQGSEEAAEGGALEEQGGEPLDDEGASPSDIEAQLSALERLQPACTQLLASHGDRARQRRALRGTRDQ